MLNFRAYDHINLTVNYLQESVSFYQKAFGFEVKEEGVSSGFGLDYKILGLSHRGFICLYQAKEKIPEKSRINHIGIHVDNLAEALPLLKEQNIEIVPYGNEEGLVTYPSSNSVYIRDPDGNEIELSDNFGGGL